MTDHKFKPGDKVARVHMGGFYRGPVRVTDEMVRKVYKNGNVVLEGDGSNTQFRPLSGGAADERVSGYEMPDRLYLLPLHQDRVAELIEGIRQRNLLRWASSTFRDMERSGDASPEVLSKLSELRELIDSEAADD